jgi:Domain of unknown function (DUF4304)
VATNDLKAPALFAAKQLLSPLGYRKTRNLFSRKSNDVVHLIEIQGSRQSTAEEAQFTVNVGIFVPTLVYADVRDVTKPSIPLAHWRARIGSLSPENEDLWWNASNPKQAMVAAQDVVTRIQSFAIPTLVTLSSLESLLRLWQSGKSPGVTDHQRLEFLVRLGKSHGSAQNAA